MGAQPVIRIVSALLASAALMPGPVGAQDRPIAGFEVGSVMDAIAPGEFLVDPPTLENLGFRWYVAGDSNRNSSVEVTYRRKGDAQWKPALPMLRVHHEVANQAYGPYRCGNLFAGSVMFLQPGSEYELRFVMRDPDGGAPPPKTVTVATRTEPLPAEGRTIHVYPEGHTGARAVGSIVGLMEAYGRAEPGDVLLLHAGVYRGPFVFERSGIPDKPITFRGRRRRGSPRRTGPADDPRGPAQCQ